jgi:hypothetical protein
MKIGGWFGNHSGELVLLFAIAVAASAAWLIFPGPSGAQNESVAKPSLAAGSAHNLALLETATGGPAPATSAAPTDQPAEAVAAPPSEAIVDKQATPEKSPLDGLKISSQSWRRGGLGSKALVTLTLRNANDYAVKDIEIACAFARRDGSHLTDRKRVISDTINMKSRKTYAGMLVGFVNVNANKARCSLVTASRS